ncbi:MAG: hypothetical protein QM676_08985 [Novosphingobium sp.]
MLFAIRLTRPKNAAFQDKVTRSPENRPSRFRHLKTRLKINVTKWGVGTMDRTT